MNETRKKLCIGILVFMNMHKILEAAWYEKITADGEKKIQHTIPRLKRIPESLLTNEVYPANSGLEELLVSISILAMFFFLFSLCFFLFQVLQSHKRKL